MMGDNWKSLPERIVDAGQRELFKVHAVPVCRGLRRAKLVGLEVDRIQQRDPPR